MGSNHLKVIFFLLSLALSACGNKGFVSATTSARDASVDVGEPQNSGPQSYTLPVAVGRNPASSNEQSQPPVVNQNQNVVRVPAGSTMPKSPVVNTQTPVVNNNTQNNQTTTQMPVNNHTQNQQTMTQMPVNNNTQNQQTMTQMPVNNTTQNQQSTTTQTQTQTMTESPLDIPEVPVRSCSLSTLRAQLSAQFINGRARSAALVDYTYCLFYGRNYDASGRGFWRTVTSQINPLSMEQYYGVLFHSSEFQGVINGLSNSQYVDLIYNRVLGRAADAAGKNFHVSSLNAGASRYDLYMAFINSSEFQSAFAPVKNHHEAVAFLYARILNRTQDQIDNDEGSGFWMGSIAVHRAGRRISTDELAISFANSSEFEQLFLRDDLSARGVVRLAYKFFLQREPEAAGLAYWTGVLRTHAGSKNVYTQDDFVQHLAPHFVASQEFKSNNPWYNSMSAVYDY